jgi:hypothetical protein
VPTDYAVDWLTWVRDLGLGELSDMAAEALQGPVRPGYERVRNWWHVSPVFRICPRCRQRFSLQWRRSDARFCSPRCQRGYWDEQNRPGRQPWRQGRARRPAPKTGERVPARVIHWADGLRQAPVRA